MIKSSMKLFAFLSIFILSALLDACGGGGGSSGTTGAVLPSSIASYKTHGINFSPYLNGQGPSDNLLISESQIRNRLSIIAPYTKWIRTFGTGNGFDAIPRIAKDLGLKTAAGAYLSNNLVANQSEIANIIAIGQSGTADILIIGNEVLLNGFLTEQQLVGYIRQVRNSVPQNVLVTTVDTYNQILAHPGLVNEVDVVAINMYPYFEGVSASIAVAYLDAKYKQVQSIAGGKKVIVTETGWPSGGANNGNAVVSPANAATYFINFVSWARANSVDYFYFEAFDEAWKAAVEGPQGSHWGIWDAAGVMKAGMQDVFDGKTVPDNWSGQTLIGGPGIPTVNTTSVPAIGATGPLRGSVAHVIPANYNIAVYIKVAGGWWTKPFFSTPLTSIFPDGSWICNIVTGGSDANATNIAIFLVPKGYAPPLLSGGSTLPAGLSVNSVAQLIINR